MKKYIIIRITVENKSSEIKRATARLKSKCFKIEELTTITEAWYLIHASRCRDGFINDIEMTKHIKKVQFRSMANQLIRLSVKVY